MAGVKGMKGGGGARPGAGRKPKPKPPMIVAPAEIERPAARADDMLAFLQDVAMGRIAAEPIQVRAAIAAVQYTHTKRGDGGKKEAAAEAASQAAKGRFAARTPPKLIVNNR